MLNEITLFDNDDITIPVLFLRKDDDTEYVDIKTFLDSCYVKIKIDDLRAALRKITAK